MALLPGALVVYLSFNAGGFFPGAQALAVVVVWTLLAAWLLLADRPFAGLSWPLAVAAGMIAAFAAWVLLSSSQSESSARALLEFDRVLLYLGALLLFGVSMRAGQQLRWLLWGLAAAFVIVCGAAVVTRLLPDVWETAPNLSNERLSYPLTYWNALGVMGALGVILCLHLASRATGSRLARVLAAAAVPLLASTVYFTFSRGAMAVGIVGVVAYVLIGRPRGLASGLLATVPATAVALVVAYDADLLATARPTTAAATEQGHDVAVVLAGCIGAAALIRVALFGLDARMARLGPLRADAVRGIRIGLGAVAIAAVALALALGLPGEIGRQYDRFASGDAVSTGGDFRERLTQPGSAARVRQWEVALDQFERSPITGEGAGSYEIAWDRERPVLTDVVDAHSLYLEVMGELGIVGLVLLAGGLVAILIAFAVRARGPDRPTFAALLALGLAWALHAGIDWDWEATAVTVWLFAAGGMTLATLGRLRWAEASPPAAARVALAVPLLLLMAVPIKILSSEAWLERSRDAFARGACAVASEDAEASLAALGNRPEPYELQGYCAILDGDFDGAIERMRDAIARDPDDWNLHYGLAIARGAAGIDPRPAAAEAARLNPLEPLVLTAVEAFDTAEPAAWRRRALFLARQLRTL